MKTAQYLAVVLAMTWFSGYSIASTCSLPTAPAIPEGQKASEKKMLAVQADVKDFIAEGRQYLSCVKNQEAEVARDAPAEERQAIVDRYNTMIDTMKKTSHEFNQAVAQYQSSQKEAP